MGDPNPQRDAGGAETMSSNGTVLTVYIIYLIGHWEDSRFSCILFRNPKDSRDSWNMSIVTLPYLSPSQLQYRLQIEGVEICLNT